MEQKTEERINEAIDWIQQSASKAQEFAVEQAPLYCQEVVDWCFWSAIAQVVVGLVLAVLAYNLFHKGNEICKERGENYRNSLEVPCYVLSAAFAAIALTVITVGTFSSIKAKVAPRMIIIEHIQGITPK